MVRDDRNINYLISKYYGKDEKGQPDFNNIHKDGYERWSKKYTNNWLNNKRNNYKRILLDKLTDFKLSQIEKTQCYMIIKQMDFNDINYTLSNEQIITMIILYVKTSHKGKYWNYKYMLDKQDLKEQDYINFLTKLCKLSRDK